MSYFSKFPVVQYPIITIDKNSRFIVCRNILRRVSLLPGIKENSSAFVSYSLLDGEKPEHISEKIYGREGNHWLVMLSNDVLNVYEDWHKPQDILEDIISKKHSGYRVYFTKTDDTLLYDPLFHSGATLSQGEYTSSVVQYAPNYCSLWIEKLGFQTGTATITTSQQSYTIKIQKVMQGADALHHFEIKRDSNDVQGSEKVTLDPLSFYNNSYSNNGGSIGGSENPNPSSETDGIGYTGSGVIELWETNIGKYMGISGAPITTTAVSNKFYEMLKNEDRRNIRLMTPLYRDQAAKQMESILRD